MNARRTVGTAAVVLTIAALTACGAPPFVESVSCASWVDYETDADRFADADAVIVVTDVVADGTESVLGFDANAYAATIDESEKGPFAAGESVRVASTADNCAARPYGDGDPMADGGVLRLYLTENDGVWRTMTPFDGVIVVD